MSPDRGGVVVRLPPRSLLRDDHLWRNAVNDRSVADGEVLVAAKLHSGRKTDLADVLAAVPHVNFPTVASHLHRGDEDALHSQLRAAQEFIEGGGLDHRFKSMFGQSSASADDMEALLEFLDEQQQ